MCVVTKAKQTPGFNAVIVAVAMAHVLAVGSITSSHFIEDALALSLTAQGVVREPDAHGPAAPESPVHA